MTDRRQFIKGGVGALAFAAAFDLAAESADNPALAAQKKWFHEAQYGMMVHWGLYSLLGGEWKGTNKRIVCDYTSSGDNEIPKDDKSGMLYETCATINDSGGYKPTDQNWKSAETIRANREHLKSIGANYLLNVGPDGLGRIPAKSVDILLEAKI